MTFSNGGCDMTFSSTFGENIYYKATPESLTLKKGVLIL